MTINPLNNNFLIQPADVQETELDLFAEVAVDELERIEGLRQKNIPDAEDGNSTETEMEVIEEGHVFEVGNLESEAVSPVRKKIKRHHTKEHKEEMSKYQKAIWEADSELRERFSNRMTKAWKDPEFRETRCHQMKGASRKISDGRHTPKFKEERSKMLKKMWQDPEFSEHISQKRIEMWQKPGFKEHMSQKRIETWQKPEFRKKQMEARSHPNDKKHQSDRREPQVPLHVIESIQRNEETRIAERALQVAQVKKKPSKRSWGS